MLFVQDASARARDTGGRPGPARAAFEAAMGDEIDFYQGTAWRLLHVGKI
jgi:hypothetical protein